jgi:hypothetical protein
MSRLNNECYQSLFFFLLLTQSRCWSCSIYFVFLIYSYARQRSITS